MEFSTLCLNFNGNIDLKSGEISYMNFLKLKYSDIISESEIRNVFEPGEIIKEGCILHVKNAQVNALYLTVRETTLLVGLGNFWLDKWISPVSAEVKSLRDLKEEILNYYYC